MVGTVGANRYRAQLPRHQGPAPWQWGGMAEVRIPELKQQDRLLLLLMRRFAETMPGRNFLGGFSVGSE
jgi:hypothetical protein